MKKMSRDRQKRKEELNSKYQEALNRFQQNPSNVTKLEILFALEHVGMSMVRREASIFLT